MVQTKKPKAIVCDLEGTTTSIRFYPDVLSPFIKDYLETCLYETWGNQETMDVIACFRARVENDILKGENCKFIFFSVKL